MVLKRPLIMCVCASGGNQCRVAAAGEETQKGRKTLNLIRYLLCLVPPMTCSVNAEKRGVTNGYLMMMHNCWAVG